MSSGTDGSSGGDGAAASTSSPAATPTLQPRSSRALSAEAAAEAAGSDEMAGVAVLSPATTKVRLQQRLAALIERQHYPAPLLPATPALGARSLADASAGTLSPSLTPLSPVRTVSSPSAAATAGSRSRPARTPSSSIALDDIPQNARVDDELLAHVLRNRAAAQALLPGVALPDTYHPLPPEELQKLENLPLRMRVRRCVDIACPTAENWLLLLGCALALFAGLLFIFGVSNFLFY